MKPTAILTSDWHIRDSQPECRTDDFEAAQWEKIDFIAALQRKYKCPVLHAGDLFHHWKPSPYLLAKTIQHLPDQFHTIYGQHDLPQHNLELRHKSGIYVLEQAGALTVLEGTHWGQSPVSSFISNHAVLVWHKMVWIKDSPYPGAPGDGEAYKVLRKYGKNVELILTGDNHQSFIATGENCILVNPGNITRQTAAQVDFNPCVYLWDAEMSGDTKPVYLPIKRGVVSREHIQHKQEQDARISAFVERLDSGEMDSVNFETNLAQFFEINKGKIRQSVVDIINKSLEEA
ncbi:MAG: metallophosphoesterase family protein [Clostridia bacterium]|nr:metallophosphoesterase family protein [Clostridia bacterium]